jgi:hypothetical protein
MSQVKKQVLLRFLNLQLIWTPHTKKSSFISTRNSGSLIMLWFSSHGCRSSINYRSRDSSSVTVLLEATSCSCSQIGMQRTFSILVRCLHKILFGRQSKPDAEAKESVSTLLTLSKLF